MHASGGRHERLKIRRQTWRTRDEGMATLPDDLRREQVLKRPITCRADSGRGSVIAFRQGDDLNPNDLPTVHNPRAATRLLITASAETRGIPTTNDTNHITGEHQDGQVLVRQEDG